MKVLIVYDSLYGNTEKIAQAIQEGMGANEIQMVRAKDANASDLQGVRLLVVGSPTHGGRASAITKQFFERLNLHALDGKGAAAFDTGIPVKGQRFWMRLLIRTIGYASRNIAKLLAKKGASVIGKMTFFVNGKEGPLQEGELERAKEWAGKLLQESRV
jgi:flavodoxin